MRDLPALTDRVLVATVILLALYDVAAGMLGGGEATISARLQHHAARYPVIPMAVGMIVGHVFWPVFGLRD